MAERKKKMTDQTVVEEPLLGQTVFYTMAEGDDTPELVAYPMSAGIEQFAAIVARVHPRDRVDIMVLDPSRGPLPRWKVPFSEAPLSGHWCYRIPRK